MVMNLLWTQSDIAREFGVSRQAVSKWIERDDFPTPRNAINHGRRVSLLYSPREVREWHKARAAA